MCGFFNKAQKVTLIFCRARQSMEVIHYNEIRVCATYCRVEQSEFMEFSEVSLDFV